MGYVMAFYVDLECFLVDALCCRTWIINVIKIFCTLNVAQGKLNKCTAMFLSWMNMLYSLGILKYFVKTFLYVSPWCAWENTFDAARILFCDYRSSSCSLFHLPGSIITTDSLNFYMTSTSYCECTRILGAPIVQKC